MKGLYIDTVEKVVTGTSLAEGVVLKYAVENTDNTIFLHPNAISIVVSSDLWRGVSIELNNLEVPWIYTGSMSRGILLTSYQDVFWHTLVSTLSLVYTQQRPNFSCKTLWYKGQENPAV